MNFGHTSFLQSQGWVHLTLACISYLFCIATMLQQVYNHTYTVDMFYINKKKISTYDRQSIIPQSSLRERPIFKHQVDKTISILSARVTFRLLDRARLALSFIHYELICDLNPSSTGYYLPTLRCQTYYNLIVDGVSQELRQVLNWETNLRYRYLGRYLQFCFTNRQMWTTVNS